MSVADAFDAVAGSYDQARRRLVPCFDAFYGTAVEVAAPRCAPRSPPGVPPRCWTWARAPACCPCC